MRDFQSLVYRPGAERSSAGFLGNSAFRKQQLGGCLALQLVLFILFIFFY